MLDDQLKLKQFQNRIEEIIRRQNSLSEHIEVLSDEIIHLKKTIDSKSIVENEPEKTVSLILPEPENQDYEIVLNEEMVDQLAVSEINEKQSEETGIKVEPTLDSAEKVSTIHEKYKPFVSNEDNIKRKLKKNKIDDFVSTQEQSSPVKRKGKLYTDETTGVNKVVELVVKFFSEGNPVVRIGMVILFFGLSFLVMYAANKGFFPIEFRLTLVGAIAISLIALGWGARAKEGGYGLVLQGGGVAGLYLTLFAASKFYSVLPLKLTFALMFVVVVFSVIFALMQNAQVLALMATAGGFLAPILTSDGSKNYIGLFTFYLLLNIGILFVAWFKTWRLLNWVGFMFTFTIFSIWALSDYEPANYYSTQPFLIAFFGMYLAIAVLFSIKQPPNLKGIIDGSLIFGMPITAFGLQAKLLNHTEYGLAISALTLAIIYICLATWIRNNYIETHRNLFESFIALGVTFGTLAIPLALNYEWTSASWAIESVGLVWVGLRQQHLRPRVVGVMLYIGSVISLLMDGWFSYGTTPFITGDFFSMLIFSIAAFCIGYFYFQNAKNLKRNENDLSYLAMVIGWLWWLSACLLVAYGYLEIEALFPVLLVFFTFSCLVFSEANKWLKWPNLKHFQNWLLPLATILSFRWVEMSLFESSALHPADMYSLIAFLLFLSVQYLILWKQASNENQDLTKLFHIGTAWFAIGLIFWEAAYMQNLYSLSGGDAMMLWLGCFTVPLMLLMGFTKIQKWPFLQYRSQYKDQIPAPLMIGSGIWFVLACTYSGTDYHYIAPFLNPFDAAMLGIIILAFVAIRRNLFELENAAAEFRYGFLGVSFFIWLNVVLLRAINFYYDVNYQIEAQWNSSIVQMAISILWTLCALIIMKISREIMNRALWKIGGLLLIAVVIKLFTIDLSDKGTLERIISFMVVGGLMLLIGYLAPIPSKKIDGIEGNTNTDKELKVESVEENKAQ